MSLYKEEDAIAVLCSVILQKYVAVTQERPLQEEEAKHLVALLTLAFMRKRRFYKALDMLLAIANANSQRVIDGMSGFNDIQAEDAEKGLKVVEVLLVDMIDICERKMTATLCKAYKKQIQDIIAVFEDQAWLF